MKITATIICKNEADHIEDCLRSIAGVDQVVLCDTGSTDNTIALAQTIRPDLVLLRQPWTDHFADARNAALDASTGDWCLIIDCDETLKAGTVDALRRAIAENPNANTLRFLCQAKGDESKRHYMVRAHARIPSVRWVGRIHEALTEDSRIIADGCVLEYGYSTAHASDPDRALRLLKIDHAENPDNPRTLYYLAREYMYRKDYLSAIPLLQKRVSNLGYRAECADAWLYLARCYWATMQGDQARAAVLGSLLLAPDCKESLLFMAEISFPEQAKVWNRFAEVATNEGCLFVRET
jgi:glycosyltransferase involved in cell wall biosynthesis